MEDLINKLNNEQKESVLSIDGPVMVMAGAGSGKTRVLTLRIAHLINDCGVPSDSILAVTFTNKAANEMKERISNYVSENIKGMWVATFHAICTRILRREIGIIEGYSSDFTIIDEDDANKIIKDEVKDLAEGKIDPISPRDLLEIMITSTNAQCPMQIDEVTILSSVSLEGTNVVYNYSLDEDVVTMDVIEQNKISIKSNLKQALSTPDPTMKQMIGVCKGANTGISYRYVGNTTGNVCVIKFSPSEL